MVWFTSLVFCVSINCEKSQKSFRKKGGAQFSKKSHSTKDILTQKGNYGAESNPTGDPIGGGMCYSDIIDPADADFVVNERSSLLSALGKAGKGQVVYVLDKAEIDMEDMLNITISGSVTLASGRGRILDDGIVSQGGLIFTKRHDLDLSPIFVTGGPKVCVTDLRFQGPDPEVGDHDYSHQYRLSGAIRSDHPSVEIHNCELWGWSYAAIRLNIGATNSYIHHNYIHHNRRTGYGYGVAMGQNNDDNPVDALVEANLFDFNRHHVTATGDANNSYECRYNIYLGHDVSGSFDRHGTSGGSGTWVGGYGGAWTKIHHNTFRDIHVKAVHIRGIPRKGVQVHDNWFYHSCQDSAVELVTKKNCSIYNNFFGSNPPHGTILPAVEISTSCNSGKAPLTVFFDAEEKQDSDSRILSYHWNFGDGSSAVGDEARGNHTSYTFVEPGVYNVTLTVTDERGIPSRKMIPIEVIPSTRSAVLSFWVKDSYRGSLYRYRKQVLLDDDIIWEDDVAGDEKWVHISKDVTKYLKTKKEITLRLRVYCHKAVTDPENQIIELYVYWDDVSLFGGDITNGDFELPGGWFYSESSNGKPWSGKINSSDVRSGNSSYFIYHPYKTNSSTGSYAEIKQVVKCNTFSIDESN